MVVVDSSAEHGYLNDTKRTQSEVSHDNILPSLYQSNMSNAHKNQINESDLYNSEYTKAQNLTMQSEEPQVADIEDDDTQIRKNAAKLQ